ncbi:MAG TPA: pyruvate kinase [Nitrospirae bacterium]|nr:pyruvate kinase [bacterium BMS3Abin10]GBE39637.1 pyruvate kinase [bacterium BMS3Bbin08]HDO25366.1 pyruvate kinase [Nitrospirota bacterium]
MRKVKIICTIGPATNKREVIHKMVKSGMDVARLNFSHGTHSEHKRAVEYIRQASQKYNTPVAILQDLRGLKIRVGSLKNGAVMLKKNSTVVLTTKNIEGDNKQIPIAYSRLNKDVKAGDRILMDDGLLQLKVTARKKTGLVARVIEGGVLKEKKGVNLPGAKISGAVFTRKDMKDLEFGLKLGIDYVAMSFVSSKDDIIQVKKWLKKFRADVPVIAKIERPQALKNIDEIVEVSDGLMIARGDLGVEVSPEKVPLIQKHLIAKCNRAMKPVITATQMLESMTEHMRPTRAEAADVANAVIDGTDALMLSAETSVGKYPVEVLKMMDRIVRFTETHEPESSHYHNVVSTTFAQAIAESACFSAMDIKAKAIVCFSRTGFTALLVSKFRPQVPIVGFTVKTEVRRRMNLYWGISPQIMKFPHGTDEMISGTEKALLQKRIVKKGDSIVIIATSPFTLGAKTNIMKLHKVGL